MRFSWVSYLLCKGTSIVPNIAIFYFFYMSKHVVFLSLEKFTKMTTCFTWYCNLSIDACTPLPLQVHIFSGQVFTLSIFFWVSSLLYTRFTAMRLCKSHFAWTRQLIHWKGLPCLPKRREKGPCSISEIVAHTGTACAMQVSVRVWFSRVCGVPLALMAPARVKNFFMCGWLWLREPSLRPDL